MSENEQVVAAAPNGSKMPKAPPKSKAKESPENNHAHAEARCIAWGNWADASGVRWNVTLREGMTAEDALRFLAEVEAAGISLIGMGWIPVDSRAQFVWPPPDEQAARAAEIESKAREVAAEMAREEVSKLFLNTAKIGVATMALHLGLLSKKNDEAGINRIKDFAEKSGHGREVTVENFGQWVGVLCELHNRDVAVKFQAAQPHPGVQAPAAPPPPVAPPPVAPQQQAPIAPQQPQAAQPIRFDRVRIAAKSNGAPKVDFMKGNLKYPVISWSFDVDALLALGNVAQRLTLQHLQAIGSEWAMLGTVHWTPSAKTTSKGTPYKDIVNVVFD